MSHKRAGRAVRAVRPVLGTAAAGVAIMAFPEPAAAHALGQTFQLPVPLWLYLAGAAIAVAASFMVTAVVARAPAEKPRYPTRPIPSAVARPFSAALRLLGLVWWYGAIVAGVALAGGGIALLPAVLFWIGIWVGLPIVAVVFGNPWPSLSPFRTTFAVLEWLARRLGLEALDAGLRYPPGLSRWPAVTLLAAAAWAELVLADSSTPRTVATLMGGYTLLTLIGMVLFGRVEWLRNAELFEVYLGWFGRIGPVGRRTVTPTACEACEAGCDPASCVDCPECAVAAEPAERRPELRPWFAGLTEVARAGWADATLIVLALATVSYDGLRETAAWGAPLTLLLDALLPVFGPTGLAFYLVDTAGLAGVALAFFVVFVIGVSLTRVLGGPGAPPLGISVGTYAATLLPIAGGYILAHYLTLVLQGVAWVPTMLADLGLSNPATLVAPNLDWMPISAVWYLSVGAIVTGHIAAIVLAHRIALRDAPSRATVAGLPLVALMVGYTILSLWIIAQPIVIEPGVTAAMSR